MARRSCVLQLLLLVLGQAAAALDNNCTGSALFRPQPQTCARKLPIENVQNVPTFKTEPPVVDFAEFSLKYLPTSSKIQNEECRLDSLLVERDFRARELWALNSEYAFYLPHIIA
jgi:hypothetical protein